MSKLKLIINKPGPPTTLSDIFPNLIGDKAENEYLPGEIISPAENPSESRWALLPMYKIDQNGKERVWQIGFDPDTNEIVTIHGCVGGKLTTDRRAVETKGGKSILEQALQDTRHRYQCKWRKEGHRPKGEKNLQRLKAQAAIHYNPPWLPKRHSNETSNIKFPVGVQPKLDGGRVRVWLVNSHNGGESVEALTRTNNRYVFFKPHKANLAEFLAYLPPGVGLDGEWYNHEMNFDELNGICRVTKNYNSRENELKMYIFDIIVAGKTVEERYSILIQAYHNFLADGNKNEYFEILNITWAHSHEEIVDFHNQYVDLGYEGLMIRKLACSNPRDIKESYYRGGRNNSWLKFKSFIEEEGIIIDVTEGQGREKGVALFVVRDPRGNTFQVRPKGSFDWRRKCIENPDNYIGRLYTYQFFEYTQYGLPRFPRGKALRDKKDNKGVMVI